MRVQFPPPAPQPLSKRARMEPSWNVFQRPDQGQSGPRSGRCCHACAEECMQRSLCPGHVHGVIGQTQTPHQARMKDKTEDILACNPVPTPDSPRHRLASRAPEGDARVRALQAALDALAAAAAGFTVATIDPKARSRIGVVRGAAMQTAKGHNAVF